MLFLDFVNWRATDEISSVATFYTFSIAYSVVCLFKWNDMLLKQWFPTNDAQVCEQRSNSNILRNFLFSNW